MISEAMQGISVVVAAYNAERTIRECLNAIVALDWPGNMEVIVVDDGSTDRTAEIVSTLPHVKLIRTSNRGGAQATNTAIKAAHHDIVVTVDSDAILAPDWLRKVLPVLESDPAVAAAGGYAVTGNRDLVGKLMGYDVELRLARMPRYTDHLYTMNTAFRREALMEIGLFDESMRVAYDPDISRRLIAAGYKLVLVKEATCTHYWRTSLWPYLKQQYSYAYYRLELTRKFGRPQDSFAGWGMILQAPVTGVALGLAALGPVLPAFLPFSAALLVSIHIPETIRLLRQRRDASVLALPFLFTARNLAWVWGAFVWSVRRVRVWLRGQRAS
jgi:GT2 family glycosyltransferase